MGFIVPYPIFSLPDLGSEFSKAVIPLSATNHKVVSKSILLSRIGRIFREINELKTNYKKRKAAMKRVSGIKFKKREIPRKFQNSDSLYTGTEV